MKSISKRDMAQLAVTVVFAAATIALVATKFNERQTELLTRDAAIHVADVVRSGQSLLRGDPRNNHVKFVEGGDWRGDIVAADPKDDPHAGKLVWTVPARACSGLIDAVLKMPLVASALSAETLSDGTLHLSLKSDERIGLPVPASQAFLRIEVDGVTLRHVAPDASSVAAACATKQQMVKVAFSYPVDVF